MQSASTAVRVPSGMRYEDWLHLRLALFSCYQGRPGLRENRMIPSHLTAWLIQQGWGEVQVGSQILRAGPGQWLIPPPVSRIQRFSADVELLSLNFYAQWPTGETVFKEGLGLVFEARRYPGLQRQAAAINRILERLVPGHDYRVFTHDMSLADYLGVQQQFMGFFAILVDILRRHGILPSTPGKVDPRLSAALTMMASLPLDTPFRIPVIARKVGISAVHLNRLATHYLGHTLAQHWDFRRAEYARRCLAMPGIQVKQVGLSLGFSVPAHFSRWFNRVHGMPPKRYCLQAQSLI